MANIKKFPATSAKNGNRFTLDDGTKEITLVNPYGKVICKLHIRTGDIGIYDRYKAFMENFDSIIQPLSDVDIGPDGTVSFEDQWETVKKVEADFKQQLNELLDMDEADAIFATRKPFSSVNGHFFAENVITVLGQVIASAIEEETKLSAERIKRHLDDLEDVNGGAGATSENT